MKDLLKQAAGLFGILVLAHGTALASVTLNVGAGLLQDAGGSPLPQTGLVVLVASTSDSQFSAPTATSFVADDDLELARFDCSSLDTPGMLLVPAVLSFAGAWTAGDPLALLWFPTLATNASTPGAGTPYGFYRDDVGKDHGAPWVTPANGSTIALNFVTEAAGGSNPDSAGLASHAVADCGSTTSATAQQVGQTMEMTFSNASGLASAQALTLVNCTIQGTAYDSGNGSLGSVGPLSLTARTTLPANTVKVVLTATKVVPGDPATVNVLTLDTCGRGKSFDPVITTLQVTSGNLAQQRFEGLPAAEPYLHVLNGTPGLKWLEVKCNGRLFRLDPLAHGQDVAADLRGAMLAGDHNVIILTGCGDHGASAWVMISDTPSGNHVELPEVLKLSLSRSTTGLVLSWPGTLSAWQVQASPAAEAGWTNVSTKPLAVNGQWTMDVPASAGAQFFRLRGLSATAPSALSAAARAAGTGISRNAVQALSPTKQAYETRTSDGIAW